MKKNLLLLNLSFLCVSVLLFYCLRSAQAFSTSYCGCPDSYKESLHGDDYLQCFLSLLAKNCQGERSSDGCEKRGKCEYSCFIWVKHSVTGQYHGRKIPNETKSCKAYASPPPPHPFF